MAQSVRRVVTEQKDGRGRIFIDGQTPDIIEMAGGAVNEIWRADGQGRAKPTNEIWDLLPPKGGSVLRIAEFPAGDSSPPWMHLTATIDYVIMLEGEVTLVTDESETILRPGDVVVQQGAHHAWQNRSDKMARFAVILISTEHA